MIRSPFPDVEIPDLSSTDFVLERGGERGDKAALIDGPSGRAITYAELIGSVRGLASGLAERGFGKGDVFAHYAPNLPEYAVAFHGVATAGGVNTTANPLMTVDELSTQLVDSGARLLVTVPELLEKASAAAKRSGVEEIFVYGEAAGATPFASLVQPGGEPPRVTIDPANDLIALPYSSGTTGTAEGRDADAPQPRGEPLSAQIEFSDNSAEPGDHLVGVLPFFHIYGMLVVLCGVLRKGGCVVTMPQFDLERVPAADSDVRRAAGVPGAADRARAGKTPDGRSVRPVQAEVRDLRGGADGARARGKLRRADRLRGQTGIRDDGDEPRSRTSRPARSRRSCATARAGCSCRTPNAGSCTSRPGVTSRRVSRANS